MDMGIWRGSKAGEEFGRTQEMLKEIGNKILCYKMIKARGRDQTHYQVRLRMVQYYSFTGLLKDSLTTNLTRYTQHLLSANLRICLNYKDILHGTSNISSCRWVRSPLYVFTVKQCGPPPTTAPTPTLLCWNTNYCVKQQRLRQTLPSLPQSWKYKSEFYSANNVLKICKRNKI